MVSINERIVGQDRIDALLAQHPDEDSASLHALNDAAVKLMNTFMGVEFESHAMIVFAGLIYHVGSHHDVIRRMGEMSKATNTVCVNSLCRPMGTHSQPVSNINLMGTDVLWGAQSLAITHPERLHLGALDEVPVAHPEGDASSNSSMD